MNSRGLIIVVISVSAMLYFMVSLVNDFNDASQLKYANEQLEKDSLIAAQFYDLACQDSLMREAHKEHEAKITELSSQIATLKYKLRALSEWN